ncbi:unnamed protein product [Clonostachys byssicola]|uniref:DUF6604 domain-containing protein n=1 Tax=Clonostachys byssicola TaxID=160290 RepID=A0A9N9ULY6_9HYPO|nr:unnamed protein product [Clonostachys byssicola]
MLPPALKSIYQQYKADTDAVATWLATTAKARGYVQGLGSAASGGAPSGRLKGKARKQAKQVAQPPQDFGATISSKPAAQAKTYVLKISDFEPMASFLSRIESIKVPDYFAVAIERVVWGTVRLSHLRKNFSNGLGGSGSAADTASDERHMYFANVLERVRDTLRPQMEAGVFNEEELDKARAARKGQNTHGPFSNYYSILGIYEPSEQYEEIAPPKTTPSASSQPEVKYTVEQDNSYEEASFLFTMLSVEYAELRSALERLWKEWAQGKRDLASVSVATNLCFELARSMEDDIKPISDKHGGGLNFLKGYFMNICAATGFDGEDLQEAGDMYNLWGYPLAHDLLINTAELLNGHFENNSTKDLITSYNGSFGWYNPRMGDPEHLSNRENWTQDMTALLEILPDIQFLGSNMCRGIVEDELIRGVSEQLQFGRGAKTPMWLAWAFQIYLDILKPLGPRCSRGYDEMVRESNMIKNAMLNVPPSEARDRVLSVASKWDHDPIQLVRDKMIELGELRGPGSPAFKFLRRNPMHCGLWIHMMRTTFHRSGAEYIAEPGAVMVTTQLYHALRQEKLLGDDLIWEDLKTIWDMQGNASFFAIEAPASRDAYFNNYCLSLGLSAKNWVPTNRAKQVKGKKAPPPTAHNANKRFLKIMGRVSMLLSHRLMPTGARAAPSAEFLAKVLEEGRRHQFIDGKGNILPGKKEEAKMKNFEGLSPSQLVRHIAEAIEGERAELSFNYFAMHDTVWKLLEEIRKQIVDTFGAEAAPLPEEKDLPFVAGYVFATASGRKGVQETGQPTDDLINIAAEVIAQFLKDGKGHSVKGWPKTAEVGDVGKLKFNEVYPWGMNRFVQELRKKGGGRQLKELQCPIL